MSAAVLLLFTGWMALPGLAQEGEELAVPVEEEVDGTQSYLCGQNLAVEADVLIQDYKNFLDIQTKGTEDNSARLEALMSYYRYVVYEIENRYEDLSLADIENENFGSSLDESGYCASIRDQYLLLAESMLRNYMISSTASKTTFTVVDGLKEMNASLQGLSQTYHATFPGMFNKFSNAFPCYVNSCVGR